MLKSRKNRYWLYFGLALFASVGVFIFVVAPILSAAPLTAAILASYLSGIVGTSVTAEIIISSLATIITVLQQIICVAVAAAFALGMSFLAAAVIAAIDYYFATIAKTIVSIPYYLACILYHAAFVFVILVGISTGIIIVFPIFFINLIAKQVSENTTAVYRICFTFAFLAILAMGIIVAVSTVLFTVPISGIAFAAALWIGISVIPLFSMGLYSYCASDDDRLYDTYIEPCYKKLIGPQKNDMGKVWDGMDYCEKKIDDAVTYVCEVCDFRDYIDDGSKSSVLK